MKDIKMRLLFVVGNLSKKNDANINIIKLLTSELVSNSHDIFVLGTNESSKMACKKAANEISYSYFKEPNIDDIFCIKKLTRFMEVIYAWTETRIPSFFQYINSKLIHKLIIDAYVKNIKVLVESASIDVVISVSSPIVTSISLAKSNINCNKIMYQLDPYYSHYIIKKPHNKLKAFINEVRIYKSVNCVIMTDLIYKDNRKNMLRFFNKKMHQLKFPNIRKIRENHRLNSNICFNKSKINCVFIGNLYHDIRNPKYVLDIFQRINNDNILIHFIGGGDLELLYKYKAIMNKRLFIHGVVDNYEANDAMFEADILINIGNTIPNQLPSKIFDYISTGKPIINFIKNKDCPTLKYTKKYPIILNINETEDITVNMIENIEKFCILNKDRAIDYNVVKDIYSDFTIEKVSKDFISIVENACI